MKSASAFFMLLFLLAGWPAGAQDAFILEPLVPVDTRPTRVSFRTLSATAQPFLAPVVRRDGQIIRITTSFGYSCPIICGYFPVLVSADLGVLPAGEYRVEIWADHPDPAERDGSGALIESTELVVAPGPGLSFAPPHPIAGEEVTLHVENVYGRCPRAGTPAVQHATIEVPLLLEECAEPPASTSLEVPLGALPPGNYQVVVKAGQILAEAGLEVLPATAILQNGRFEVLATWETAAGENGSARLVQPPSTDSALFYFFSRANWELMVKVLDGCAINGHYWVFAAASTDVAFEVKVEEEGGRTFEIRNRLGQPAAAINSITAFSCQ